MILLFRKLYTCSALIVLLFATQIRLLYICVRYIYSLTYRHIAVSISPLHLVSCLFLTSTYYNLFFLNKFIILYKTLFLNNFFYQFNYRLLLDYHHVDLITQTHAEEKVMIRLFFIVTEEDSNIESKRLTRKYTLILSTK